MQEQAAKGLEIRHADPQLSARLQDPVAFGQRFRQIVQVAQVLEDVARIDFRHRSVAEPAEVAAIADGIDRRPVLDVEDRPAGLRLLAADVQA